MAPIPSAIHHSHYFAACTIPNPNSGGTNFDLLQTLGQFYVTVKNITHHVSIKLDRDNYLLWRQQFLPIFNNQSLMGFVDGSIEPHPKFSTSAPSTVTHEYAQWYAHERFKVGSLPHCPTLQLDKPLASLDLPPCGSNYRMFKPPHLILG
ncbi:hypothetical protein H6P81_016268 [Aristolochia fimbriata]|uniref:Retrotransposon Copia-like N-terminal domain-containing protein n=1 Tax=Aristolochia fimbriata TaxID=158543 RepID=A0AAV7E891_ARIFI|nr:hypothetical protein H6P81_016268 [Aristolochia fimbriata]